MTKLEQFKRVVPITSSNVRALCTRAYHNHPRGCPNYAKPKVGCPPKTPFLGKLIDLEKPVYAIWNIFNFGAHCRRMKQLHPNWTKYQIACCLYWQPKARKQLRANIKLFLRSHPNYTIVPNPEGAGVNVTATMKSIGHVLEWPPTTKTYQVALAGARL